MIVIDTRAAACGGALSVWLWWWVQLLESGLQTLHVPYAYGFAIILLTLLVKALTFPLTKQQVRNQAHAGHTPSQQYAGVGGGGEDGAADFSPASTSCSCACCLSLCRPACLFAVSRVTLWWWWCAGGVHSEHAGAGAQGEGHPGALQGRPGAAPPLVRRLHLSKALHSTPGSQGIS